MKYSYPKGISKEEKRKIELKFQKLMLKSAKEQYRDMKQIKANPHYLSQMKEAIDRIKAKIEKLEK